MLLSEQPDLSAGGTSARLDCFHHPPPPLFPHPESPEMDRKTMCHAHHFSANCDVAGNKSLSIWGPLHRYVPKRMTTCLRPAQIWSKIVENSASSKIDHLSVGSEGLVTRSRDNRFCCQNSSAENTPPSGREPPSFPSIWRSVLRVSWAVRKTTIFGPPNRQFWTGFVLKKGSIPGCAKTIVK